ncbi:MAG: hypothetical protein WBQ23_02675 [Bacteroidota bacterium]
MKKTQLIFSLIASAIIFTGCYYDSEEALYPQLNNGCDTTNVTYAGSIVPILVGSCYSCHSNANAGAFGDNLRLESYSDVKANLNRVYGAIAWQGGYKNMPKDSNKLSDCSIRVFEIWISQGAPNSIIAQGGAR